MPSEYDTFPTQANSLNQLLDIVKWLRNDLNQNDPDSTSSFTWRVGRHRFPYGIWFRGEAISEQLLTASVFRLTNDGATLDEAFINNHLQTRIPELVATNNTFDKLCMAQHYNVPTRLLDWTENFLTAAYFAVATNDNGRPPGEDAALYVLNAYTLNSVSAIGRGEGRIHTASDFGTILRAEMSFCRSIDEWVLRINNRVPQFSWDTMAHDLKRNPAHNPLSELEKFRLFRGAIAVMPTRANPRMLVQASTFTIHGGCNWQNVSDEDFYRPIPEKSVDKSRQVWLRCKIPAASRPVIEGELFELGIHQSTLFPELDMQRKYLTKVCRKGT